MSNLGFYSIGTGMRVTRKWSQTDALGLGGTQE